LALSGPLSGRSRVLVGDDDDDGGNNNNNNNNNKSERLEPFPNHSENM